MSGTGRPEEIVFEHELDMKYICPICLNVFWNPIQTTCGHRFCKLCIAGVVRESQGSRGIFGRCPVDKKHFNADRELFEDKAFQREVLSLKVKCTNYNNGCTWTNDLRELQHHLDICLYCQENCSYDCGARLLRQDVESHLEICEQRPVQCEHCNEEIIFANLTKHQVLNCASLPVQCTLCGQTGIKRKDITIHLDVNTGNCPHSIISCQYASFGCSYQTKRRCMAEHYKADADQHILLLTRKLNEVTEELSQVKQTVESFKEKIGEKTSTCEKCQM